MCRTAGKPCIRVHTTRGLEVTSRMGQDIVPRSERRSRDAKICEMHECRQRGGLSPFFWLLSSLARCLVVRGRRRSVMVGGLSPSIPEEREAAGLTIFWEGILGVFGV